MISLDAALALVAARALPLGTEEVPLAAAAGRRLAAPVVAAIDAPRAAVSAMDGYAVREADLSAGAFRVVGEAFPGAPFDGAMPAGGCVRVFTGAPIPAGGDRVVIQEDVVRDGDMVRLTGTPGAATFVRHRGLDFAAGSALVAAGRVVDPRVLVAAAGGDIGTLTVWRRPSIAIVASGDELVAPGRARASAAAVPESITLGLAAFAASHGAIVAARNFLCDDRAAITAASQQALAQADLLVLAGGASVGDRDFAKAALADLGLDLAFSTVAMKPGKPVWFGGVGDRLVLGLPGNPTSAMVTARLFLAPLLAGLGGGEARLDFAPLPLAAPLPACGARETFVRAVRTAAGARPLANQDSGAQKSLADADLLIRQRPHSGAADLGAMVDTLAL